jgi:hypothetical protein
MFDNNEFVGVKANTKRTHGEDTAKIDADRRTGAAAVQQDSAGQRKGKKGLQVFVAASAAQL